MDLLYSLHYMIAAFRTIKAGKSSKYATIIDGVYLNLKYELMPLERSLPETSSLSLNDLNLPLQDSLPPSEIIPSSFSFPLHYSSKSRFSKLQAIFLSTLDSTYDFSIALQDIFKITVSYNSNKFTVKIIFSMC